MASIPCSRSADVLQGGCQPHSYLDIILHARQTLRQKEMKFPSSLSESGNPVSRPIRKIILLLEQKQSQQQMEAKSDEYPCAVCRRNEEALSCRVSSGQRCLTDSNVRS
jgi:hypothetical protein